MIWGSDRSWGRVDLGCVWLIHSGRESDDRKYKG